MVEPFKKVTELGDIMAQAGWEGASAFCWHDVTAKK
jgi:hypothetical protein